MLTEYSNDIPLVSVIIPTFNNPTLLSRSIASVLSQTYMNYEVIIIDDGSSPPVKNIIDSYDDPRLQYFFKENQGLSAARNTGVQLAKGNLVALLDDDDVFLPEKLDSQVNLLKNDSFVGMALGGFHYVDKDQKILAEARPWEVTDPNDLRTWLFECPIVPSVVMLRKPWFEKIGGFDENQRYAEDMDFWIRLIYAGCKIQYVQKTLINYSINYGGISSNTHAMRDGTIRLLNKFFNLPDLPGEIRSLHNSAIAAPYLTASMKEYGNNQILSAQNNLSQAILIAPEYCFQNEKIIKAIINHAVGPYLVQNPYTFVNQVFENLPDEAKNIHKLRRKVIGLVHLYHLYQARRSKNWGSVRSNAFAFIFHNPKGIFDRGVISSTILATFGEQRFNVMRKIMQRFLDILTHPKFTD